MSGRCDAELCQYWTGHGCACDVLDIEPDRPDCMNCGQPIQRGDLGMAGVGPVHNGCPETEWTCERCGEPFEAAEENSHCPDCEAVL